MPIHVYCLGGALFFAGLLIFLILFTMERILKFNKDIQAVMIDMSYSSCVTV